MNQAEAKLAVKQAEANFDSHTPLPKQILYRYFGLRFNNENGNEKRKTYTEKIITQLPRQTYTAK